MGIKFMGLTLRHDHFTCYAFFTKFLNMFSERVLEVGLSKTLKLFTKLFQKMLHEDIV